MPSIEYILLVTSILLFLSIVASKASINLGIPALLLFLLIGMLAGSDGPGGIYFDNSKLGQHLGIVALVFILFAGGFDTKWEEVKQIALRGLSLSTLGIFITTFLIGLFANKVLNFSWLEGLLLGAIISSTDVAAVFATLGGYAVIAQLLPLLPLFPAQMIVQSMVSVVVVMAVFVIMGGQTVIVQLLHLHLYQLHNLI